MDDLLQRLETGAIDYRQRPGNASALLYEARAEIERLRVELEKMTEASSNESARNKDNWF